MDLKFKRIMTVAMATSTLLSGAAAYADADTGSEEGGLSEVVVTAQRREESAMRVPLAVSVLGTAEMAALGVTNSVELSGLAPTLQVNSAFGTVQPNFSLRGIGVGNEHNPNQASPIGVYIDDAYISARVSQGLSLFDLDRIEILRGPQGTLYGRNTTGGAINFISRMPSLSGTSGYAEAGYGTYDTFTAQGAFETTLKEDVAGVRVAFNYAHGNGWNENIAPSEPNANSTDNAAARLIFRVKPTDAWDVTFKATGGTANPTQAGVYNLGTGPDGYNTVLQYGRVQHGLSFWQTDSQRIGYNKVKNLGSELIVKYRLTDAIGLESLTSYDYADAEFTQEGTGVESPAFKQPLDTLYGNVFTMFNQEFRLSYSTDATHFQTGAYYGYDKDKSDSYYWLLDGAADIHQKYDQIRNSLAAFAQLDQSLTSNLSVTLGARVTKDEAHYQNYFSYTVPAAISFTGQRTTGPQYWNPAQGSFVLGSYDAAAGRIVSGAPYILDAARPTWRVALNYTFDNGPLVYASYNRGYRNAAFCGQCFFNNPINTTKPETDNAYEVGTKGTFFDRKLQLVLDAFWIDYRNQQTNEQLGVQSSLTNVPRSRMRGVELEATAQPWPNFRVALSAGYDDAKFEQLTLAFATVNGSQEPYAPKTTANLRFDWRFATIGDGTLTFTPSAIYTSYVYYSPYDNLEGNAPLAQRANTKFNAQLSYETGKYTVRLWGKNLANRQTFEDGLDLRSFGYYYMIPAAPRTFGVTFAEKF